MSTHAFLVINNREYFDEICKVRRYDGSPVRLSVKNISGTWYELSPFLLVVVFFFVSVLFLSQGSYRGFSSLLMRESVGNSVYFGSYELCKQVQLQTMRGF